MRKRQIIMPITMPASPSSSCRDRERCGVDVGALCLSSSGCDHLASRNQNESYGEEDRHKAPTLPHHPPPVPTGRGEAAVRV